MSNKPITEAEHVLPDKSPESVKNAAASIFAIDSDEEGDIADSLDSVKDARSKPIADPISKLSARLFSSGRYVDLASAKETVEEHIRSIFTREYHRGSYSFTSRDSRGNRDIDDSRISRIPLLYSIGGVGKTAIISSVIDRIFSEKVGNDEGGDLYKVDRIPGLDSDDVDQYSDVMNKPSEDNRTVIVIKCQGLSQDDIYMPAKDSRGLHVVDKSGKEHKLSQEAVR